MKISIIVPCYNEEGMLPLFKASVKEALSLIKPNTYELIFVDDGSIDRTLSYIKEYSRADADIKYISFTRNFGKEAAILAGLKKSSGDAVCLIDADLQDPPYLIKDMLFFINNGYDMVVARRADRKGEPVLRSIFTKLFYGVINVISPDIRLSDGERDFRMMTAKAAREIADISERNRFTKGLLSWSGYKTKWIDYENIERVKSKSKWTFFQLARYAVSAIADFSDFPLKIITAFGFLAFLLSTVYLFNIFLSGDRFYTLMFTVLFLGGSILFSLGIIGEYISRIYTETKRRPHYIINQTNI